MKSYHKNPRKISPEQLARLAESLQEFGDLSAICHDLNSGEVITGNQRSKIINLATCEIDLSRTFDTPTPQGTVAYGQVWFNKTPMAYRQVRWTEEQRERACLLANKLGGEFDYHLLAEHFPVDKLALWGFDSSEMTLIRAIDKMTQAFAPAGFSESEHSGKKTEQTESPIKEDDPPGNQPAEPAERQSLIRIGRFTMMVSNQRLQTWAENLRIEFKYKEATVEREVRARIFG